MVGFSFTRPLRAPFDEIVSKLRDGATPVFSVDVPSGWDVNDGPGPGCFTPAALVSLTAPKQGVRNFVGTHYMGGRFLPLELANKYQIGLEYSGNQQIVQL